MKELEIIYEDKDVLVIRKPAGVPVQSARVGAKDCESLLKNYLYRKNPKGGALSGTDSPPGSACGGSGGVCPESEGGGFFEQAVRGKRDAEDLPGGPVQCG